MRTSSPVTLPTAASQGASLRLPHHSRLVATNVSRLPEQSMSRSARQPVLDSKKAASDTQLAD